MSFPLVTGFSFKKDLDFIFTIYHSHTLDKRIFDQLALLPLIIFVSLSAVSSTVNIFISKMHTMQSCCVKNTVMTVIYLFTARLHKGVPFKDGWYRLNTQELEETMVRALYC